MAMTKCRECETVVSTEAKTCPKCGISKPGRHPSKFGTYLWAASVVVLVMLLAVDLGKDGPGPSPRRSSGELQAAERAIGAARALRRSMRNPDSFSVISARAIGSDLVCFRYRAQNGFGGMNVEEAAVWGEMPIAGPAFTAEWQDKCRGAGSEVTQYVD